MEMAAGTQSEPYFWGRKRPDRSLREYPDSELSRQSEHRLHFTKGFTDLEVCFGRLNLTPTGVTGHEANATLLDARECTHLRCRAGWCRTPVASLTHTRAGYLVMSTSLWGGVVVASFNIRIAAIAVVAYWLCPIAANLATSAIKDNESCTPIKIRFLCTIRDMRRKLGPEACPSPSGADWSQVRSLTSSPSGGHLQKMKKMQWCSRPL